MGLKRIFVFGNEYLDFDSFAGSVAKKFDDVNIIKCHSPDDLLEYNDITILDVVKGIDEPILIKDVDQLKSRNIMSLHDFDLAYFLKLMKELDMGKKFKIIGIPQKGDADLIAKKVRPWI